MAKKQKTVWSPTSADFAAVLESQNPWHKTGKVPDAWAFKVERPLSKHLWRRLSVPPKRFQLILGPRRVGKSTCMFQTIRHLLNDAKVDPRDILWLRMDHPILMRIPLGPLLKSILNDRMSEGRHTYVFLDELTYASEWDLWLKTFYDESWPVQIIGSSSSAAALRDRKPDSGVGRWEEQFLPPYLFTEYLSLLEKDFSIDLKDTLYETIEASAEFELDYPELELNRRKYLLTGGFPELLLGNQLGPNEESTILQSQKILRVDAVQSAIYKDIPQAFGVDNPMLLERLLYTLGGQITGTLSPTTLCQNLDGLTQPTFDKYLSYLEKAYLVFTLPNYSGNEISVQKRGRKLYFVDGAVRNAALQRGLMPLNNPEELGLLVENQIAGHLFALSQQSQVRLYHWRDKNNEVDLIYDHPHQPLALEIYSGFGKHTRAGLELFSNRYARFDKRCFLVSPQLRISIPFKENFEGTGSMPLDLFLLAVSAHAEKALELNLLSSHRQA